ncbi:MAG: cyclopropane-fatty-acyl-phospholipid synthase family protein [Pseudomonadota bacterium]
MATQIDYGTNTGSGLAERVVLAMAERIEAGELVITLPYGVDRLFKGPKPGPTAALQIDHPRAYRRLLFGGTMGFAEAYMDGDVDTPDLAALVDLMIKNQAALLGALDKQRWTRVLKRVAHKLRPNSRRGARRNIAHHYDLGNDFYAQWLDRSMTYSSAMFDHPDQSIADAQDNKYRNIARLARIGTDDSVLEIGCGWGGFCSWAARNIGCRVTAITISPAQYAFAAERLHNEGLNDKVDLRLQDYRDTDGTYDGIVSIEMVEAVGETYWPAYFQTLRNRLRPGGRAALQSITIDEAYFESYRRSVDFIQQYIFPGGMLPSPTRLHAEAEQAGLTRVETERFGPDYARTLAYWRRAFDTAWPQIQTLGFDERFRRMWQYYLIYCEAGFNIGRIDVLQTALSRD